MLNNNGLVRIAKVLAVGTLIGLVAACGGGGGGDQCSNIDPSRNPNLPSCGASTPVTPGTNATAATVQLLVSSQQLNSDGLAPVGITLIARDTNGQTVANRPVLLSVSDPVNTAFISNFSQTSGNTHATNANGQLTATLSVGGNRANRTLALTATVDQTSAANTVNVVGTTLTVSGTNALAFGATTQLSVVVTDSSGRPIANAPITATSANGNTVTLTNPTTDSNGKVTVTVAGTKAGADTIATSAAGASASYALNVSGNNFTFTSPAPDVSQLVNTPLTITVHWTNNGAPVTSSPINFASTRGSLSSSQAFSNANGDASVTVSSPSPGPAIITASSAASGGPAASINVLFISNAPANSLSLQADKTTVSINPPGTSTNTATLTAVARDVNNNLVPGVTVNFHIDQDTTGGSLSAASATTDSFGVARTQYIPTAVSSPTNGVIISAAVANSTVTSPQLFLTVGGQKLFVRIGTDNLVGTTPNAPNYTKQYSAFVTDAAGNPVPNATVQFLVRPRQDIAFDPTQFTIGQFFNRYTTPLPNQPPLFDYAYFKGQYVPNSSGTGWVPEYKATCFNEDVNFNGIIFDAGEDYNGNGKLDPGNAFSVNADSATNSAGYAVATITYPKDRANWLAVSLKATAQVFGTEASDSAIFVLPVAAADVNDPTIAPPGRQFFDPKSSQIVVISPYGLGMARICTDPN